MRSRIVKIVSSFAMCLILWQIKINMQVLTKRLNHESSSNHLVTHMEFDTKQNPAKVPFTEDLTRVDANISEKCVPRNQFVYIKTHKTGSSTLKELLAKYTKKYNISVARKLFPCPLIAGYPGPFDTRFIKSNKSMRFEPNKLTILDHVRFSHSLKDIMPSDIPFLTIVRDPWKQFQSAFYFYYGNNSVRSKLDINCFKFPFYQVADGQPMSGPVEYLLKADINLNTSLPWFFRSTNYQSFDLGIDPLVNDDHEIENAIQRLSRELDLVLITDYYDHSLLLLKDLLCLDWEDLMYNKNRRQLLYTPIDINHYPEANNVFKRLYKQDIALYKHFNDTFWRKVEEYGRERMENDWRTLRSERDRHLAAIEEKGYGSTKKMKTRTKSEHDQNENFRLAQSRWGNKTEMFTLLVKKLLLKDQMNLITATDMAVHMAKHGGSCPL